MKIVKNGEGERYTPPGHDEKVYSKKIFNQSTGSAKVDAHVTTFSPGAGMAEETHENSDHVFYMLLGQLEVLQQGVLIGTLSAGDAVHIPAGEAHQIRNPGAGDGVFLAVTVPPC